MNHARVVSSRFPYLPLRLTIRSWSVDVEALIDTGFDGDVVLPAGFVDNGIPNYGDIELRLADGSELSAPAYRGVALIGPTALPGVSIIALGDVPIVGVNLIRHFSVTLDHGQRVIIEP